MRVACFGRSAASLLVSAALLAGCTEAGGPTAPVSFSPRGMSFDRASASANSGSGAQIVRSNFPFGFIGDDPSDQLAWFVGPLDPVAAVPVKCAHPDSIVPVSAGARAQIVTTPSGRVQIHANTPQAHIAVWQLTGALTSVCQLVGAPVVATGVVHYTVEITNFVGSGPGASIEHINAVGIVDLTSGGQARLHATARILVFPDGSLKFDQEFISLTPL